MSLNWERFRRKLRTKGLRKFRKRKDLIDLINKEREKKKDKN